MSFGPALKTALSGRGVSNGREAPIYVTLDQFDSQYYSGSDVDIYFDDYFVDEAISIQYQVMESVLPLYAYADYRFRKAVHGRVIIQGSFTINFKTGNFMYSTLDRMKGLTEVAQATLDMQGALTGGADALGGETPAPAPAKDPNPESIDLMQIAWSGTPVVGNVMDALAALPSDESQQVIDNLKQRTWAPLEESLPDNALLNMPVLQGPTDGFTIVIRYGTPTIRSEDRPFINKAGGTSLPIVTASSQITLYGVELSGDGQMIDDSGRGILETYTFLAKGIVKG